MKKTTDKGGPNKPMKGLGVPLAKASGRSTAAAGFAEPTRPPSRENTNPKHDAEAFRICWDQIHKRPRIVKAYCLDAALVKSVAALARKENRSASNFVETVLRKFIAKL